MEDKGKEENQEEGDSSHPLPVNALTGEYMNREEEKR
jgi:hypothetical protein